MIEPIDLSRLRVLPLERRISLTNADQVLLDPDAPPPRCSRSIAERIAECAGRILIARERDATVMLIYGAHLLRNGAAAILERMMARGWLTHLATNGAGTIHDWEYAWFGASTESVEMNVANGTFGTWHETATNIHLAIMAGSLSRLGYGASLGKFIVDDGVNLPEPDSLIQAIVDRPEDSLTATRADLLRSMKEHRWPAGRIKVAHRWKHASIIAQAFCHSIPLTVHPGIGYDIISNHPVFNGAAIGRAAELDFKLFGGSLSRLDDGVVLNVGSAIMGPQVFEKSLSCVNNLRLQAGQLPVSGHTIYVVDMQDGGGWDWSEGEPPKSHPAYYLRFCKSFARMGGDFNYLQCDNATFIHRLYHALLRGDPTHT